MVLVFDGPRGTLMRRYLLKERHQFFNMPLLYKLTVGDPKNVDAIAASRCPEEKRSLLIGGKVSASVLIWLVNGDDVSVLVV